MYTYVHTLIARHRKNSFAVKISQSTVCTSQTQPPTWTPYKQPVIYIGFVHYLTQMDYVATRRQHSQPQNTTERRTT